MDGVLFVDDDEDLRGVDHGEDLGELNAKIVFHVEKL